MRVNNTIKPQFQGDVINLADCNDDQIKEAKYEMRKIKSFIYEKTYFLFPFQNGNSTETVEIVVMINHRNFEMMTEHPHTIKKILNLNIVTVWFDVYVYFKVKLQNDEKCRASIIIIKLALNVSSMPSII